VLFWKTETLNYNKGIYNLCYALGTLLLLFDLVLGGVNDYKDKKKNSLKMDTILIEVRHLASHKNKSPRD
jgi:hypothetical protein